MTQSRTGILATLFSQLLLIVFSPRDKTVTFVLSAIGGVIFIFYVIASPWMLDRLTDISLPQRLYIWEQTLELISKSPVLGNGFQTEFSVTMPGSGTMINSAHNAFLATWRDGGLIGLGLHLLILTTAARISLTEWYRKDDPLYCILLIFGLLCMLTATDQLVTRPRELWVIFWLPVTMILAAEARQLKTDEKP